MSLGVRQMSSLQIVDYAESLERRVAALQAKLDQRTAQLLALEAIGHLFAHALFPPGRSLDPPSEKATAAGEKLFEDAVISRKRPRR